MLQKKRQWQKALERFEDFKSTGAGDRTGQFDDHVEGEGHCWTVCRYRCRCIYIYVYPIISTDKIKCM